MIPLHPRLRTALPVVVGLSLFIAALAVLHRLLGEFRGHQIIAELRAVPAGALWAAAALTAASYLLLTAYDWLAAARRAEANGRGDWADALLSGRVGRTEAQARVERSATD